ncbi:MAG: S8 family serine peptidase, partial [Thermoplasmata archaeon]
KVIGGYDFYNHDSDPMDDNGHGTHVAGVVAADGAMIGVAPDARLLAYKSLGSDGMGSMSDVIAAIDASLDPNGDGDPEDRVDVISMSLGGQGEVGDPICMAVQRAVEAGVVVVVAAGNSGPSMNTVASPGVSPHAVTVGAVDDSGALASFSSRGPTPDMTIKPDLSAPGVNIVSTIPMDGAEMSSPTGYMAMSGTSMATPHVGGAAALLLQLHPDWTPSQVKSALVLGASEIEESVWSAGAGEVWIPESADMQMFYSQPIISYGLIDNPSQSITITNTGPSITISSDSSDWFSLYADGEEAPRQWTNASSISPTQVVIPSGSTGQMTISIVLVNGHSEGYYEGDMILTSAAGVERLPFGFVILSRLAVHVLDLDGQEVFDPYGGVWVFDLPDADIAMGMRGNIEPAPPAVFFLPSGTYSVHSFGHQLLYTFSNPYILSTTVTLDRVEMVDVYLRMSDARIVTIDLGTSDGVPIYVKDYRVYCRHEGGTNISFDLGGSDYSVVGSDAFSIPDSVDVFISDTDERIGISIAGFSYSPAMWNFMELNWEHWYEYTSGTSTEFMVEASADLQYLMSWEFDGVDSSIPSVLGLDPDLASAYITKYDIPGAVVNPWCDWGTHRSIGGDATFFVRRDTDTSLNPFFSGMTRTTFVQGVFSELYYPYSIFEGFIERQFYEPNYDHVVDALTLSKIQVPDRYYLTPLPATLETQRIGAGPFYPSLYMSNTNDTFVLFQPLLRDQSGAKVGGVSGPSMTLYRGGSLIGVYSLSEYLARPDAVRIIDLTEDGEYSAAITYEPSSQVTDSVTIDLGFTVPGDDVNPPHVTALQMPQKFVPGESIDITLGVADEQSVDVVISWKPTGSDTWTDLSVVAAEPGVFETSLTTGTSDTAIDLKIDISDPSGNYLVATMTNAALEERDVLFELYPVNDEVSYRTAPDTVLLLGTLTDELGSPIHPSAGVPLELMVDGEKVGMILDEYVTSDTHSHDGSIRFEWRMSPTTLFSG